MSHQRPNTFKYHPHVSFDDMYVTKRIKQREYEIIKYIMEHNLDITPKIISLSENIVVMEKYDCILSDCEFIDQDNAEDIMQQITDLINTLHRNGIFHGDLNEENVVLNRNTMTVKLIDFDSSRKISSITQDYIDDYNKAFGIEPPCQTIDQILQHELTNVSIVY